MKISKQRTEKTIRDMMPKGYIRILQDRTGAAPGTISTAVRTEDTESKVWSEVLKLAEETQRYRQLEQERIYKLKASA